jgi:hypothetical protein
MEKKLFSFRVDGWSADAAFCCRAVSFAEAFCIFREFIDLYAWQGDIRASRFSCAVVPDPAPPDPLVDAYHAVILGES